MKKIIKAVYILIVAIVVFTGALLIVKGLEQTQGGDMAISYVYRYTHPFDRQEGSAM